MRLFRVFATAVAPAPPDGEYDGDRGSSSQSSDPIAEEIEIKGDQFENMSDVRVKLTSWDLCALGISTAIGGHFYLWNTMLLAGFGSTIIATFVIASAYGCLLLCMAELSSALPFAGEIFK